MAVPRSTRRSPRNSLVASLVFGLLATASAAFADDIRAVSQATNDLVFDQLRGKIYASVPGSAGAFANSVVAIDPVTSAISRLVSLGTGAEPGKLALSDDAQFLYIALDGLAAVRRVDLTGVTPDIQFLLGSDPALAFRGPWFVDDMAVVPGTPRAVAVALRFRDGVSPRHAGVAVYDDSIRRPLMTTGPVGSTVIEFSGGAARLYGFDTETAQAGFRRMLVSAAGVSIQDVSANPFGGFGIVTDIAFDSGRLYATNGQVIDPETRALVGTYPGVLSGALVRPDSTSGRTYFLAANSLSGFGQATFTPIGSFIVSGISGVPGSLIRWGAGQLAFRTTGGQADRVYLITADFTGFVGPGPIFSGPPVNSPRRDFLTRVFQAVLARNPEPAGLAAWDAFLMANCNAAGLRALSAGFFDSEEFRLGRPLSLEGLVDVLYRTFLERQPEPAAMARWTAILRELRLQVATDGFIPSLEFGALLPDPRNRAAATEVLRRLYAEILGRAPDPAGLEAWLDFLAATGDVKAAARGFLTSAEFEARALTAREYVAILYRTFLGREPSAAELDAWEAGLRSQLLRVIDLGFAASAEFQAQLVPMCR